MADDQPTLDQPPKTELKAVPGQTTMSQTGDGARAPDHDGALDIRPIKFSDESLALQFTERHASHLRYCAAWGKWLIWDGTRWAPDATLHTLDLARQECRVASAEALKTVPDNSKKRIAAKVASFGVVAAVVRLARADRRHATVPEDWDRDTWLLNTPGGILDLRSGDLQPHDLQTYCTKITGAEPAGECPTWRKFLNDVTGGDGELQGYLQRVAGYCLTGSIREHAVFFAHGSGGNGKSVFLSTIAAVMGHYAITASMDVFVASKGDRHPTEVAMLRGARLVTAFETEQGRRWDEAKLKALTGGDPITARFMRQDFFTFKPQFKLFVVGNHRPAIRNVDPAMRRRLHLIPFTTKIAMPDEDLPEKLRAESPAILAWMVQGCLDWQRQGLYPPQAVIDATAEYFETEDAFGRWIEERCSTDSSATVTTANLFADWREWANEVGEFVGTEKRLAQTLKQRGYERWRDPGSKVRGFRGIVPLKDSPSPASNPDAPQPSRIGAWSEEY